MAIVQTVFQGTFLQIQGTARLAIQVGMPSRYPAHRRPDDE
jgi:hypothetical protein